MTTEKNDLLPVSRRDALKGVGLAALGVGGATDAALAGPSSKYGWLVTHSNYGTTDPQTIRGRTKTVTSAYRFRSIHTLEYLGAQWDPYISPDDESEGSWHHSFRLAAFGGSNFAKITKKDSEVVEREFRPWDTVTGTELRVRTEDASLAIAPRRDAELYGFLLPESFRDTLSIATVPENGDTTLSAGEQLTQALSTNPGTAASPEYLGNRRKMALTGGSNAKDYLKTLAMGPLPELVDNAPFLKRTITWLSRLDALLSIAQAAVVKYDRMNIGFDYEFPYENKGVGGAHYVYFDVYVPRGETGRFTVKSLFDTGTNYRDPYEHDTNTHEDMPSWEDAKPQWEIEVTGPENDTGRVEAATPLEWNERTDEETKTTVPLFRKDPDELPVQADLDSPQLQVEPGEVFTANASDSQSPVQGDLRFDLAAYRAFGYGDGPYPTPGGGDGRQIVHGSTADLDVTEVSTGVFDVALDVDASSVDRYYDIEVTVTDSRGITGAATDYVYVPPTLPVADLQLPDVVEQGDTVTLDATETEGYVAPEDYDWDVTLVEVGPYDEYGEPVEYPDDEPEEGPISVETPVDWQLAGETPKHAFDGPLAEKRLVYEVELTATSTLNPERSDTVTRYLTVAPAPNYGPTASIVLDGRFVGGKHLTLDGSDSTDPNGVKDITSYDWTITRQVDDWSETRTGETAPLHIPCSTTEHAYTVELTVTDDDGETGTATANFTVPAMEDPGPTVELTYEPTDPIVDDDTVTYTAEVSGTEGTPEYEWAYSDPGDDTIYTEPGGATFERLYNQSGDAFVSVTVTDDCGAQSDDAFVHVRPNPEPTVSIDGPSSATEGDTATYTATIEDDQPIADVQWSVFHPDGSIVDAGGGTEFTYTFDDGADVTIVVTVTDQDDATATDDVAISVNDLPDVSLTGPSTVSADSTHEYEASVPNDTVAEYEWSDPNGTTTSTQNTHSVSFGSADGTVSVTATDPQGASATASIDVTVNDGPTLTLDGPTSVTAGDTATYTAIVDDPDDSNHSYTWTYGQDQLTTEERGSELTYTFDDSTDFFVQVTVEDPHGATASADRAVTVSDANDAPTVSLDGPTSATEGDTVTFSASASDPDGDSLSYSWTYGQDSLETETGVTSITDTVTDASTDFFVQVTVEDSHGATASADRTIDVKQQDTNDSPSVSLSGPSSATVGDSVTFTASASDPDGDSLSYEWLYGQDPLEIQNGGTSITDTLTDTTDFYVSVTVEDEHGATASASRTVSVSDANDAPSVSISYSPSDPVTYETVSISADASDPDGDSLSYSWSGASISGSSGTESWSTSGYKDVSVTVSDGHGNSATDTVSIYVSDSGLQQSRSESGSFLDRFSTGDGALALAASALLGSPRGDADDTEVDR